LKTNRSAETKQISPTGALLDVLQAIRFPMYEKSSSNHRDIKSMQQNLKETQEAQSICAFRRNARSKTQVESEI